MLVPRVISQAGGKCRGQVGATPITRFESFPGTALVTRAGVPGAMLAAKYFDHFVIATSAYGGGALCVFGGQWLLSQFGASAAASGTQLLATLALTAIGARFQLRHMHSWTPAPLLRHAEPAAEPRERTR